MIHNKLIGLLIILNTILSAIYVCMRSAGMLPMGSKLSMAFSYVSLIIWGIILIYLLYVNEQKKK